jgi:hypothetical protein
MTETKRADEGTRAEGDEVESAGDTTAAATVGDDAPDHHKPVGADTRVRVAGEPGES